MGGGIVSAEYADQILKCIECRAEFLLTSGQQRWFADRNMMNPKRCEWCRKKKREQKELKSNPPQSR